tara:strand:+ start:26619 stop:27608 length:990 start_codon:yes stop_codon:yes gene_type:complete
MNIAILDDYQSVARNYAEWSKLEAQHGITFFSDHISDHSQLITRLQPFDIIMGMRERTPFPKAVLSKLPNLKLLITSGARNASFDTQSATALGILICGTGGSGEGPTELTWGLIINLLRNIPREISDTKQHKWGTTMGVGLKGKTIGLLGLGHIGSLVARVAKAFDMNVIAWSQNMTESHASEHSATLVSKEELFALSDIVSIHVRLSDRTRDLVTYKELSLMKSTSYIINISRGPIINENDLVQILRDKGIAGAGLDTFDVEPLPDNHPLLNLDNVIITPHIGYVTQEAYSAYYSGALEDIEAFIEGTPINMINPEVYETANFRGKIK